MKWLLLLPQLPAGSSTARVALWRQLRACGATSAVQGAWVLPAGAERKTIFEELAQGTASSGGTAAVFECEAIHGLGDEDLIARFRADRAREYDELATKVGDFHAEIEKETRLRKFDFAELEEIEDDLAKLNSWHGKIRDRDFFPDSRADEAADLLDVCKSALDAFSGEVYRSQAGDTTGAPPGDDRSPL